MLRVHLFGVKIDTQRDVQGCFLHLPFRRFQLLHDVFQEFSQLGSLVYRFQLCIVVDSCPLVLVF